ncbi:PilZ domain-containing protein [Thiomicrorhabdus sediminis]|uniref:PilZ domain-containing protein n=1 Tax=Thiomicrorhabdus sediminis TaxID=2580412 RepID=A0A4V1HHM0_9GAMM|nr:PilZ domain-containing protein [Thiomicrorhabdus sediminis]QCU89493.1 PilZ domain-containing protein [Thiomicrorhabdus sediminis]
MEISFDEKRGQLRIDLKTTATLCLKKQHHSLYMLNISLNGADLLSDEEILMNENASLEFTIPGYDSSSPLKLGGAIKHQTKVKNQYLVGFEFYKPSTHDTLIINEYFNFHQRHAT